jgi:amidase
MAKFDPLTATAAGLQRLLESQLVSSVEIVDRYLDQIHRYNQAGPQINALLAVAPRHVLLSTAMALDEEREQGKIRGPLHGIPVILKDNIMTHPELGMPTTAGSWAFVNAKPKNNAALVKKLLNAGMIIIAKGNMTVSCEMSLRNWETN